MTTALKTTMYTAEAVVEGGREGHARSSDGRLDVELDVPSELEGTGGPGTNPEQLFAVGYAACFQSALMGIARGKNINIDDCSITSRVGTGPVASGGFGLEVRLELTAPSLSVEDAAALMTRAHKRCAYSRAIDGNVPVELAANGVTIEG
ncbi:MAG: Ohr family peroxiredoxin [Gaiellales bacterium]